MIRKSPCIAAPALHPRLYSAPEGKNLLCLPNAEPGALRSCNFQLIHFYFFALLAGFFSGLAAYFPPSHFSIVIFLFNTTTLNTSPPLSPPPSSLPPPPIAVGVGASRRILRYRCRHWIAATTVTVVGPPLGCCHATRPTANAASKRCPRRP